MEPGAKVKRGVNAHEGQIVVHSSRAMSQGRGGCRQFKLNATRPLHSQKSTRQRGLEPTRLSTIEEAGTRTMSPCKGFGHNGEQELRQAGIAVQLSRRIWAMPYLA
jgi:hypothetical protein